MLSPQVSKRLTHVAGEFKLPLIRLGNLSRTAAPKLRVCPLLDPVMAYWVSDEGPFINVEETELKAPPNGGAIGSFQWVVGGCFFV